MLYSRNELLNLSREEYGVAIQRYLFKIQHNDTRKLLSHECDFLCLALRSIYRSDENGRPLSERAYEPYDLPFLSEVVFKYLIYLYFQNLDFLEPVYNGIKNLSKEEIARDKLKFDELLSQWQRRLFEKKCDHFLHEVKLEYNRKIVIINRFYDQRAFGYFRYLRKCLEQELLAFYVYITVKMFFKDIKRNYVEHVYQGHRFIINIYSYVHILSRHYMPLFNSIDAERSFNSALPFIEPFSLPLGLKELLNSYFQLAPKSYKLNREYLIFDFEGDHYIIWWKFKRVSDIRGQIGLEIRTLYKIHSITDLALREDKVIVSVNSKLSFCY